GSGRGRRHPRGAGAVAGRRRGRGHLRRTGRLGRARALRPRAPERQRGLRLSGDRPDVSRSEELFDRAQAVLPGGVNSPVRAFRAVGGTPFFVDRARGACLTDVDGKTYLDYVCSWGPLILGHAHPAVLDAIRGAAERGWTYGAPCAAEVELAELVRRRMPALEMVRFVNSGTEATMAAVRVARAATRREVILKFEGCYHGHADGFLVMTGCRVAPGGAQQRLAVRPDLTTLGKILGGGLPVGAYGGRADLMRLVAPEGPVYQAGTLSGNPVAMAAGLATLRETERPGFYDLLERRTARLVAGIGDAARRHGVAATGGHAGSMWGVYLTAGPVRTFAQAKGADTGLFARWHRAALARGVFLAPSAFEAGFVSSAHTDADIDFTVT